MHMGRRGLGLALMGLFVAAGCDGTMESDTSELSQEAKAADNGTYLSAKASAGATQCTAQGVGLATVTGQLTSTAAGAWANVNASVDGAAPQLIDQVESTAWLKDGRTKTFDFNYSFTLPDGTHTIEICFVQPSGQARMTACATVTVVVSCTTQARTCTMAAFGETVGNRNMCAGNGTANINIQAKGDFGDNAMVTISGPNAFSLTAPINHSGESCVYHYNWATRDNNHGGPGTYTYTVSGNGQSTTWTAAMFCK
jgi:hypothetical protein